ncbi:retrotransposon protein, putative, ty1-copia subclass [Tanacetum coccineum]
MVASGGQTCWKPSNLMAATAQNTNNTTIRSILLAEKLTGSNFTNWYRNLRIVLRYEKKIKFVEQPIRLAPDPATSNPDAIDKYYASVNLEQKVACLMLSIKAFHACKQEEGQSVSFYLLKMKSYLDTLERLGYAMPKELGVSHILNSLNKDYDQFIQNYNMHSMGKTLAELHVMTEIMRKVFQRRLKLHMFGNTGWKNPEGQKEEATKGKWTLSASTIGGCVTGDELSSLPMLSGREKNACHGTPLRVFQNEVENQLDKKIKAIRSDLGGEYLSHEFVNHTKSCGIVSQLTPPYTPQHNGVSKRRNQTLLDMVRSIMNLTTLLKSFWGYALETAARILNMVPTKKVDRTPYEIWHGKSPKLSYLRDTSSTDRYGYMWVLREWELEDLNEPPNYKAALADPESDKWLEAMNTEMQSIKDNQVWYLVDLPSNGRIVGCKWLFKKKTDMDGNVHTFKAHLIAKDFTQTYGVDYEETFSLEIKKISFTQNPDEPCVYLKASGSNVAFLVLHVDDILLVGNSVAMLQEVKYWLCKYFSMKDLGEAVYILGIKIICDTSKRLIALSQSAYLDKTLKKFRIENSKKRYTPMMEKLDYRKSQGAKTPTEVQRMQRVPYASAIGSIMYAVRCTRPDVAFTQNLCSRFQQNPREIHWTAVKTILNYLHGYSVCRQHGYAVLEIGQMRFLVKSWADRDDTKSQTGYVFVLNGGAVDWKSAKQSTTAMSSIEAEYIAAVEASMKASG